MIMRILHVLLNSESLPVLHLKNEEFWSINQQLLLMLYTLSCRHFLWVNILLRRHGWSVAAILQLLAIPMEVIAVQLKSDITVSMENLYMNLWLLMFVMCGTGVSSDPVHQKYHNTILNLTEGTNLNYSLCELTGPNSFDMVVCLTRNKSDKLEQLLHDTPGNCVQFSDGKCTMPFNNSITKMQISMFEASSDKCFPSQRIRFIKKHVSL